MSSAKRIGRTRVTQINQRTATPGVYFRNGYYIVLTRPDGVRKVRHRFETYDEAVAFKATTPSRPRQPMHPRGERPAYLANDPCAYCGGVATAVDHIVPRDAEGADNWTNMTASCRSCNSSKGTKSLLIFLAHRHGCWQFQRDLSA